MQLDGKTILITGAGSGIGRALAVACAGTGANLVLAGRRQAALAETAMRTGSRKARVIAADVTDAADRARIAKLIGAEFGRLDVLVNNAGTCSVGFLGDLAEAEIAAMVNANLLAPMLLARELLPLLRRAAPGARIVNVGSIFGDIAYPLFAAYSATKFGLRGFSDAMRRELGGEGIGVTYVAPRATRTPAAARFEWLIAPFGMAVDPAERVAEQITAAILDDARSSYARGAERLFVLIQRLLPALVDRAVSRQLAQLPSRPVPGTGD